MPDRQVPIHPIPRIPPGITAFGTSAIFEELAIQPLIDIVFTNRWHDGPLRQRHLSLILEKDLAVVCLLTAEPALVDKVMMAPA